MSITYEKSGVNIDVADATKREMAQHLSANTNSRVMNKVGAFASLYDFCDMGYKEPVLVLKTEEPGTKQKLAVQYGKIKNICYDMINHLTNDIMVMGAKPLTVQDAIICGKLEQNIVSQLVKNISQACKDNGSVLTGGETSEQPNVLDKGIYVLTSSIVGIVEKSQIIDGSKIQKGDVVVALASNGVHTNGYSFLRMMMADDPTLVDTMIEGENEKFIDVILRSHRAYYPELKALLEGDLRSSVVGMAHITGGGIAGNLNRILPSTLSADVDLGKIQVLPIFKFVKERTNADDLELMKTFNMGVGMTLVIKQGQEDKVIQLMKSLGLNAYVIGNISDGDKTVRYSGSLKF